MKIPPSFWPRMTGLAYMIFSLWMLATFCREAYWDDAALYGAGFLLCLLYHGWQRVRHGAAMLEAERVARITEQFNAVESPRHHPT